MEDVEKAKAAAELAQDNDDSVLGKLLYGMFLGIAGYGAFVKREMLIALVKSVFGKIQKNKFIVKSNHQTLLVLCASGVFYTFNNVGDCIFK